MKAIVIKIGGSMAEDRKCLEELATGIAKLAKDPGTRVALVHGGGKDIDNNLKWLGQEPKRIGSLRVTDEKAMDMVEMTLSGRVNKKLVRLLIDAGAEPCGISGVDAGLFTATPLPNSDELGFVGTVSRDVKTKLIETLWEGGFIPVVSPVSLRKDPVSKKFQSWNVNADDAARELAMALAAMTESQDRTFESTQLVFISDVPGVLRTDGSCIRRLLSAEIDGLITGGLATGGMIPKLQGCQAVVAGGVSGVAISGWSGPDSLERILNGQSGTIIAAVR